eukprot:TRINITY_DN4124_c1_g1_i2.p1 TRINITY_DN4124_c1_g1~~TRINITY_DN4124_c1_g1_i2.p1  ORF type:complete len:119 (+),score=19.12 TRINITY_DN4124_c1_g1_i2:188-544(+)
MGNIKDPNNPEDNDSISDTDSEVENPGNPPTKPVPASGNTSSAGPSAPSAPLSYGDTPEARGSAVTPWVCICYLWPTISPVLFSFLSIPLSLSLSLSLCPHLAHVTPSTLYRYCLSGL